MGAVTLLAPSLSAPFVRRAQAQSAVGPIKIGYIVPLTGAYGADAAIQLEGAKVAIEQFNEAGGLNGRMAELLVRDDKLNPGEASARAQELIEKDGVHMLAGCFGAAMLSVNTIAKQRNVVYNPVGQSDAIVNAKDWGRITFHEGLTPFMTSGALARHVIPNLGGTKRVALLVADYVFGHELARGFKPAAEALGAEIVSEVRHPLGATDFSALFPRIMAMKPDLLVVMNFGRDQLITFKQAAEFGLRRRMQIATPLIVHTARLVDGHRNFEGIIGGTGYYWALEDRYASAKTFNSRYRAANGGRNPTDYAGMGYASVLTLLTASHKAGSTDVEALIDAMRTLKYDFYKGPQHYRSCDHQSVQSVLIVTSKDPTHARVGDDIFDIIGIEEGSEDRLAGCAALGHKS